MKKRRVTVNLDEDIVEALEAVESRSLSATVNAALRESLAADAHRRALLGWLDELNALHGPPAAADYEAADALLDTAGFGAGGMSEHRQGAA